MPRITIEKNLIVGVQQGVELHPTQTGDVVLSIVHQDVRILLTMTTEEATGLGVGFIRIGAIVETMRSQQTPEPGRTLDGNGAGLPLVR